MIKLKKAPPDLVKSIRGFAVEAAVWFSLPLIFLYFYSQYPVAGDGLIFAHLKILISLFLILCAARGFWRQRSIVEQHNFFNGHLLRISTNWT
jgi:hypothetical protein